MVFHALSFAGSRGSQLEREAAKSSVKISSEGPGKCYCNEITMDNRCSCITYDSNGNCDENAPKLHINSILTLQMRRQTNMAAVVYNGTSCSMTL